MSRHAAIDLDWADGTYTFRLSLDQIEELERRRELGIFTLAQRLSPESRQCRSADIVETLRLGLIGGGMKPIEALAKVRIYADQRPLDENRDIAYAVIMAGLMRLHSNELEQSSGEAEAAESNGSTSPPSEAAPSS